MIYRTFVLLNQSLLYIRFFNIEHTKDRNKDFSHFNDCLRNLNF